MKPVSGIIALLLGVPVFAGEQAVLLEFRYQEGQVLRYRGQLTGTGHMTLEGQAQPLVVKGQFVLVQKVGPQKEGGYELTTTVENARLSFRVGSEPEQSTTLTPAPLVQVVTRSGRVLSEKGWAGSEAGEKMPLHGTLKWLAAQMPRASFPEAPVQVGQTWTQDLVIPNREEPAKHVSLLKGFEKWKSFDCARVDSTVTLPIEQRLPPDPIGTDVSMKGQQRLETVTLFAHGEGLLARQQTSVVLHVDTEARLRDVKDPVKATMDVSARVTMELESPRL